MEVMKITKSSKSGHYKFLQFPSFYTEFTESLMDKQYSDSTKQRYLKHACREKIKILSNITIAELNLRSHSRLYMSNTEERKGLDGMHQIYSKVSTIDIRDRHKWAQTLSLQIDD